MINKDKKERALILVHELHGYLKRGNIKVPKLRDKRKKLKKN